VISNLLISLFYDRFTNIHKRIRIIRGETNVPDPTGPAVNRDVTIEIRHIQLQCEATCKSLAPEKIAYHHRRPDLYIDDIFGSNDHTTQEKPQLDSVGIDSIGLPEVPE